MTPWRAPGRQVFKSRIYDRHGRAHVRTLATEDPDEAERIDAMCVMWRRRRKWHLLDLLIERRARAVDLLDAHESGTLESYVNALDATRDAELALAADVDLDPLVAEWAQIGQPKPYVRQVRSLIPAGARFPRSRFTRAVISKHLATLPHTGPTRNRYRAAISQFAVFLIEREILTTNVVRDVRAAAEHDPRMIYHTREQAQTLVAALPSPFSALEALMAGTGVEWSAMERVRGRDIRWDKREVWADGAKNTKGRGAKWRKRWVRFTEDWAWQVFAAHARQFTGNARVFAGIAQNTALRRHHDACKALGIPDSVLHDWRHSYAIYSLADLLPPQTVKRNLGHSPHSTELERVYAAWIPFADRHYEKGAATPAATRTSKPDEVRRAK